MLFEESRPRLEAIAYRLLGSAADAEDAGQDTYLRWQAAERALIETPEAWLTKVLTNLCLNRLASARARRETYVGQWLPEPVFAGDRMLGPSETVEQRESVSIAERKIVATDGGEITYDTLVYALGSTATNVPENAYHSAGKQAAQRLHARLEDLGAGGTVLVVGGGLTGIEGVTEIAKARQHLRQAFDRLGITVHEGVDGRTLDAEVTVWTAGFAVHPIAAATTLEVSPSGQIVVDETMRSVSHPDVYAVGDAALAHGRCGSTLRTSCASGIPTAHLVADAIAARLTGREVPQNKIGYNGQCISLGKAAVRIKEFICKTAAWSISHPTTMLPARRRHVISGPVQNTLRF